MNNSAKSKRLDMIELQLTPKHWAIRLADEMRRYASQEDFLKAIGRDTFRQSPFIKPYYYLAKQAEKRWPGDNRKVVALSDKLREEFHVLKTLIYDINRDILVRGEMIRLKAKLQMSKARELILKGIFVYSDFPEIFSAGSPGEAQHHHTSLLENWFDNSAKLFRETTAYMAAVQAVQEKYFESHPILYKDFEKAFEMTNQAVRDSLEEINKYVAELSNQESDHERQKPGMANAMPFERENILPIDIEAMEKCDETLVDSIVENWVRHAEFTGSADILRETGIHEDFVWQHFRKIMGVES
jgi:hypothetical protein